MASNKELLEDVSFDREIVPRDGEGDLLVSLLKKKAYSEGSAIDLAKYPIKEDFLDRLIKEDRVRVFSKSPMKIYLTSIGKIVACGEFALRRSEKKK
jgi:hypothetical protein